MRCKTVIDLHMEDGYAGRDYSFVCQGCRQVVTELSPGRIVAMLSLILGMGILGGLLVGFGLAMLLNTLTKSSDSNEQSAVIGLVVLFLVLGIPSLLGALWAAKSLVSDLRTIRRNPIVS
jgi:ABC-type uncharacterized transport system permease subunit